MHRIPIKSRSKREQKAAEEPWKLVAEKNPTISPTRSDNQWHKTPRKDHKIQVVGDGKRQQNACKECRHTTRAEQKQQAYSKDQKRNRARVKVGRAPKPGGDRLERPKHRSQKPYERTEIQPPDKKKRTGNKTCQKKP
jgi:hypothetical protein